MMFRHFISYFSWSRWKQWGWNWFDKRQ